MAVLRRLPLIFSPETTFGTIIAVIIKEPLESWANQATWFYIIILYIRNKNYNIL